MVDILSFFPDSINRGNGRFLVPCPAHRDEDPSLDVLIKSDKIVLHCYAGCSTDQVLRSLGLSFKDLFLQSGRPSSDRSDARIESVHDYRDLGGKLLYQSVKYRRPSGDKFFRQRRPCGPGKWEWNLEGVSRVLYRLHDLERMTRRHPNRIVVVVEGEKDADRLHSIDVAATTIVCGANAPWLNSYSEYLSDKHVAIVPDNDEPGLEFAARAAGSLLLHDCHSIRVVGLDVPPKGDVSDWLDADPDRKHELYGKIFNTPHWSRK